MQNKFKHYITRTDNTQLWLNMQSVSFNILRKTKFMFPFLTARGAAWYEKLRKLFLRKL